MRFLGILILATSLSAATLERLSLDDMIRQSTGIVSGKITGASTVVRGSVIYTRYTVQIGERWKGSTSRGIEVFVPGGRHGAVQQTFSGSPTLVEGKEYMLFLWAGRSGITQVIGLSQGLFDLKRDPSGEPYVTRGASADGTMVDASGRTVEDTPVSLRLREMVDRIHRTLAGVRQDQ
jgi:hypothetical protein